MTSPKELDVTHACQVASGDPVRDAFSRLGPVVDFSSVLAADDPRDLAKCLAAEQIAHLVEGWRYCAAAFHASLVNATDNAQHFAYYAELRAAMPLFSGSGIRVNRLPRRPKAAALSKKTTDSHHSLGLLAAVGATR
mgnify:CR=1 FL=1